MVDQSLAGDPCPTRMRIQLGQAVTLQLDHLGGDFIRGEVAEIAEVDLQDAPAELVQAGELAAKTESDRTAPVATSYLVRVKLNPGQTGLLHRATGQARRTPGTAARARVVSMARRGGGCMCVCV